MSNFCNDLDAATDVSLSFVEVASAQSEDVPVPPPPPVDAVIRVLIKDNGLSAYLNITPPENGGAAPTLEGLKTALIEYQVTDGIDWGKLEELVKYPVYQNNIMIARGTAPEDGIDGTYKLLFQTQKNLKPKELEDGSVDYHDLGIVENVRKDQVLCTITHPTDGTQGISVTGQTLMPVKGKAVPSFLGNNTQFNHDDTAILATIDGQVEFNGVKINVNETLYIRGNVDNSTGNIKVMGNVIVYGMVFPGFIIEAGGNIDVKENVESAELKADGNIILHSGITGSQLNCKGDLTSRFIENCNIYVKGSVKAEYIMSSQIKCGKNLQLIGRGANFVGGSCVAGQDIIARVIGSASGVKTKLEIGTDPSIIERQQELTKSLPALEKQIKNLDMLITLLQQLEEAGRLTPDKKKSLDNVLLSSKISKTSFENGKKELAEITELIEKTDSGKVMCKGTMYPGTKVKIGAATMAVTDLLTGISFFKSEGVICQGPA